MTWKQWYGRLYIKLQNKFIAPWIAEVYFGPSSSRIRKSDFTAWHVPLRFPAFLAARCSRCHPGRTCWRPTLTSAPTCLGTLRWERREIPENRSCRRRSRRTSWIRAPRTTGSRYNKFFRNVNNSARVSTRDMLINLSITPACLCTRGVQTLSGIFPFTFDASP